MCACQVLVGSWLVMIVERVPVAIFEDLQEIAPAPDPETGRGPSRPRMRTSRRARRAQQFAVTAIGLR